MIRLADEIDLRTLEFEKETNLWLPVLEVEVIPSLYQDLSKVAMDWSVKRYDQGIMEIQLLFDEPLYISFEVVSKPSLF